MLYEILSDYGTLPCEISTLHYEISPDDGTSTLPCEISTLPYEISSDDGTLPCEISTLPYETSSDDATLPCEISPLPNEISPDDGAEDKKSHRSSIALVEDCQESWRSSVGITNV